MSSWWWSFIIGVAVFAGGVLMIVFRARLTNFDNRWGRAMYGRLYIDLPPWFLIFLALFPLVFGSVFAISAIPHL